MQVDTAQLRTAAKRLRAEVGNQLERSRQPDRGTDRDDTFDRYTGSAPYREARGRPGCPAPARCRPR